MHPLKGITRPKSPLLREFLLMETEVANKAQAALTSAANVLVQKVQSDKPTAPRVNRTVLVVDDEPGVCRLCRIVLQRAGYEVIEAGSVDSAMELWQAHSKAIDVVITDYNMPGSTGLELCEWLHAENPRLGLILTSGSYAGDLPVPSYVSFLSKPFNFHGLTDAVQSLMPPRA